MDTYTIQGRERGGGEKGGGEERGRRGGERGGEGGREGKRRSYIGKGGDVKCGVFRKGAD